MSNKNNLNVNLSNLQIQGEVGLSRRVRLSSNDEQIEYIIEELAKLNRRVSEMLTFSNHYEFPTSGEPDCLYIAKDEDVVYYWKDSSYIPLTGIESLQIEIVSGGGAVDGD